MDLDPAQQQTQPQTRRSIRDLSARFLLNLTIWLVHVTAFALFAFLLLYQHTVSSSVARGLFLTYTSLYASVAQQFLSDVLRGDEELIILVCLLGSSCCAGAVTFALRTSRLRGHLLLMCLLGVGISVAFLLAGSLVRNIPPPGYRWFGHLTISVLTVVALVIGASRSGFLSLLREHEDAGRGTAAWQKPLGLVLILIPLVGSAAILLTTHL